MADAEQLEYYKHKHKHKHNHGDNIDDDNHLDRWSVYEGDVVGDVDKENGRWDDVAKRSRRVEYVNMG